MIAMGLGPYRFEMDDAILERISRKLAPRYADVDLVGRAPGSQFLGPGKERISFSVLIYPIALPGSGLSQVEGMRQAADASTALMLVAGTGRVLGRFTIRDVDDTRSELLGNGVAQKLAVQIELARHDPVGGGTSVSGVFSVFG